jgi:DNA-binding CsgD family transcriptional regulator
LQRFCQLTPREREVFNILVRGKPHKQISYDLGISERTIKLHRHQLVEKLKARSLAELAVIAERLKLLLFVRASWRRGKQVRTRERRQARFCRLRDLAAGCAGRRERLGENHQREKRHDAVLKPIACGAPSSTHFDARSARRTRVFHFPDTADRGLTKVIPLLATALAQWHIGSPACDVGRRYGVTKSVDH